MLVFLAQARSAAALSEVVVAAVMVVVVCVVASGVVSGAAIAAGSRPLVLHAISRTKTYMQTTPVLISLLLTVA
jgi:hypothetical protein